jgi:hypothetical protein
VKHLQTALYIAHALNRRASAYHQRRTLRPRITAKRAHQAARRASASRAALSDDSVFSAF